MNTSSSVLSSAVDNAAHQIPRARFIRQEVCVGEALSIVAYGRATLYHRYYDYPCPRGRRV